MTEQTTGMSFSRRNFIKGAAALTATGALVGCAPAKETLAETGEETVEVPETKIYSGACRAQCGLFGGTLGHKSNREMMVAYQQIIDPLYE
ncbi:twin-arginine translocation signal domain-containing protein, partial [Adlercreutzia sp. DFI.6.23]|uniref:twin-arginine translocation signal domain-containing protein n=1 Tax=Adlercreutzia sp. DFI.6.23 TaxID=2963705 RepID=UPI00210B4D90